MKKNGLLIISLIACLFFVGARDIKADTLSLVYLETGESTGDNITKDPSGKWNIGIDGNVTDYLPAIKFTLDGKIVYCIEPRILTDNGSTYTEGNLSNTLTVAQQKKLEQIASVGYGFDGDTSNEMLAATQFRIWMELDSDIHTVHTDIQAKIDLINSRLSIYSKIPSFNGNTVSLTSTNNSLESSVSLNDTNSVFQYYNFLNMSENVNYKIEGNSLKLWNNDNSSGSINFVSPINQALGTTSKGYYNSDGKQTIALLGLASSQIKVNYNYVNNKDITISKQDFTTGKELAGAKMTVIRKDTKEVIDVWTSDGKVHVINGSKFVDGKEYILREEIAPKGYGIAEEITFVYKTAGINPIVMKDKLLENPVTGISNPTIIFGSIITIASTGLYLMKKKNLIKGL